MTTGAPNKDVIAFIGSVNSLFGSCAILSQINKMIPPSNETAGINILWLEVLKINFVMWGTANPIKAIGPQKAVITTVNKLVIIRMMFLLFFVLIPRLFA